MKILVSVIIPNYNSAEFIEDTLNSVLSQSYRNNEIIIVDDGSTDGSYESLLLRKENNVKVFRNPGKGACAARNYGLKLSKGEYIQFLDADDLISFDKIERQLELLRFYPNRVAVCSTAHFHDSINHSVINDHPFMFSTKKPENFLLRLYGGDGISHNMVAISAWLTPRNTILQAGEFDESLTKDQDGEYFCRVVMASSGVVFEPNALNFYRKHVTGNNISSGNSKRHLISQFQSIQSKEKQLLEFKQTREYRNAFALQYKLLAINAYPQFRDLYKQAYRRHINLGGSTYMPVLGGKIVEAVKLVLGWRWAKAFTHWIHKFI